MLTAPLRDRFGVVNRLEFYTEKELQTIIMRSADVLGVEIEPNGDAGEWRKDLEEHHVLPIDF